MRRVRRVLSACDRVRCEWVEPEPEPEPEPVPFTWPSITGSWCAAPAAPAGCGASSRSHVCSAAAVPACMKHSIADWLQRCATQASSVCLQSIAQSCSSWVRVVPLAPAIVTSAKCTAAARHAGLCGWTGASVAGRGAGAGGGGAGVGVAGATAVGGAGGVAGAGLGGGSSSHAASVTASTSQERIDIMIRVFARSSPGITEGA